MARSHGKMVIATGHPPGKGSLWDSASLLSSLDLRPPLDLPPESYPASFPPVFLLSAFRKRSPYCTAPGQIGTPLLSPNSYPNSVPTIGSQRASRSVPLCPKERAQVPAEQDGAGRYGTSGTEWDSVDPPRNAQVVGSSPTSGSKSAGQTARLRSRYLERRSCPNNSS
jgi:hypothetical protein